MRTRLDEIVNSERENGSYHYSAEGERCRQMRIAERAFAHGVEQTNHMWRDVSDKWRAEEDEAQEKVQPAEAGSQQPAPASPGSWSLPVPPKGFRHTRDYMTQWRLPGLYYASPGPNGVGEPRCYEGPEIREELEAWELRKEETCEKDCRCTWHVATAAGMSFHPDRRVATERRQP